MSFDSKDLELLQNSFIQIRNDITANREKINQVDKMVNIIDEYGRELTKDVAFLKAQVAALQQEIIEARSFVKGLGVKIAISGVVITLLAILGIVEDVKDLPILK